jgi:hypothetical protein
MATSVAVALLITGLLFWIWTLFTDLCDLLFIAPFWQNPDAKFLGMLLTGLLTPLGMMLIPAMALYLAATRCARPNHVIGSTLFALFLIVIPLPLTVLCRYAFNAPTLDLCVIYPAALLGVVTGSPLGWYLGSAIQVAVAVWLLKWISLRSFMTKQH